MTDEVLEDLRHRLACLLEAIENNQRDIATHQRSLNGIGARFDKLTRRIEAFEGKGKALSVWECEHKLEAISKELNSMDPADPKNKDRRKELLKRRDELRGMLTE